MLELFIGGDCAEKRLIELKASEAVATVLRKRRRLKGVGVASDIEAYDKGVDTAEYLRF